MRNSRKMVLLQLPKPPRRRLRTQPANSSAIIRFPNITRQSSKSLMPTPVVIRAQPTLLFLNTSISLSNPLNIQPRKKAEHPKKSPSLPTVYALQPSLAEFLSPITPPSKPIGGRSNPLLFLLPSRRLNQTLSQMPLKPTSISIA